MSCFYVSNSFLKSWAYFKSLPLRRGNLPIDDALQKQLVCMEAYL